MNKLVVGVNDLESQAPDVASEWHPELNDRTASQVCVGSKKLAWWRGECGHEWEAPILNRSRAGTGCPFCSGNKVLPGFNDLTTKYPNLALEWSDSNERRADEVTPGSTFRALWQCPLGHSWRASVNSRTKGGSGCWECAKLNGFGPRRPSSVSPSLEDARPDLSNEILLVRPDFVTFGSTLRVPWICSAGHTWVSTPKDRNAGYGCRKCAFVTSSGESELVDFVTGFSEVKKSDRTVIRPYEIDILLEDQKIALEYNGVYWHSEKFKSKNYHLRKSRAASEAGYQLIHVWEDDWRDRREVVERLLARKIGVSSEKRLNGRGMEVRPVGISNARDFLDANHIQGYSSGSVRLGLYEGDLLRAVMIFRSRGEGTWELSRFATSAIVRGGFSKLLKAFKDQYVPGQIVSFSDRGVSDGGVYEASGFVRDGEIPPDYSYVVRGRRVHKFNYRKSRFKSDPSLKFEEGLTERQLAELNGLLRVYDAGKTRWVWTR